MEVECSLRRLGRIIYINIPLTTVGAFRQGLMGLRAGGVGGSQALVVAARGSVRRGSVTDLSTTWVALFTHSCCAGSCWAFARGWRTGRVGGGLSIWVMFSVGWALVGVPAA